MGGRVRKQDLATSRLSGRKAISLVLFGPGGKRPRNTTQPTFTEILQSLKKTQRAAKTGRGEEAHPDGNRSKRRDIKCLALEKSRFCHLYKLIGCQTKGNVFCCNGNHDPSRLRLHQRMTPISSAHPRPRLENNKASFNKAS